MRESDLENILAKGMQHGHSASEEQFRDELLARCLEVLDSAEHAVELADEDIEMLAAAGDAALFAPPHSNDD